MARFDLTGIGNAIVDVISPCEDDFLNQFEIEKGGMTLIDQARAHALFEAMENPVMTAGGSAANTMVGFSSFGGKGNYIGLVAKDVIGDSFANDTKNQNVHFETTRYEGPLTTATSHIFVTPDGERSMNTYLGACAELNESHIDEALIAESNMVYMEGYLFDKDPAKAAFKKAGQIAHANDRQVALTLSDSFCVHRHRNDFKDLIQSEIDILFANEAEICAMFETDDLDQAIEAVRSLCPLVAVTRSHLGSIIVKDTQTFHINAEPVIEVMDSTGAGDQYAAGFLFGLMKNQPVETCGLYASKAASEVIGHIGPRPQVNYKEYIAA